MKHFARTGSLAGAILVASLGIASADTVTVVSPFATLNLGSSATAGFVSSASLGPIGDITSIVFAGGTSPGSGEYAGSTSTAASPYSSGLANYLVAEGSGGTVTVTFATAQTSLALLWGTVDTASGQNVILTGGAGPTTIDGANVLAADPSLVPGTSNVYVDITGLPSFTTVTFSDTSDPAFEFNLAATPLPAGLPLFAGGLALIGAMGLFRWRRQHEVSLLGQVLG